MADNDFYLTAEQREMRDLVRTIARDRIAPRAAEVDETEAYPEEGLKLLGDQGLMGLYIPEAYGGTDMGTLAFCLAVEEIAWACASSATIYLVQYAGGWQIVAAG
jgi:alkylation response protein AidB-like acyl-CoA dehydrogenase